MKAVICTISDGVHIHTPGKDKWEACQCGYTGARWEDPEAGKLIVACRARKDHVFGLGLNNQLLVRAITQPGQAWEDYRNWHDIATDAPGYVFDKSRAGCWAVVFRIGSTGDTRWATDAEYGECFPVAAASPLPVTLTAGTVMAAGQAIGQQDVTVLYDRLTRDILESLCRRDGLSLDSAVAPGEPARNYELADRLGLGRVFGLREPS